MEIFQLTAAEVAVLDEEMVFEYTRKHEYRLANMSGRVCEQMIDAMVADNNIEGGWFYTLEDGIQVGPFESYADAKADARTNAAEG